MNNVNEHILRITGSSSLPVGLELDKRYLISIEVDCTDIAERSNQDGTVNRTYKCTQTGDTQITADGKNIIKAAKKQTRSQAMHRAIWHYHNVNNLPMSFDSFYDMTMAKINANMPEVIAFVDKLAFGNALQY